MKEYKFEIIITEGCDEFWEGIEAKKSSGCGQVTELVREAMEGSGFYPGDNCEINLVKYTNK